MAAPPTTAKQTPAGIKLKDGFHTTVCFNRFPTVSLWIKTPKPPGFDGGDPIEQTTMHNTYWRTTAPRSLVTLMPTTFKAAYDPDVLTDIQALINAEGAITYHFPDETTWDFWGFLQKVEFDELKEGTQPECTVTICPTNFDPVNRVEAAPVVTSVTGT